MDENGNENLNFTIAFAAFLVLLFLQIFVFAFIQSFFQELAGWRYDTFGNLITIGAVWGIWIGLIITEALIGVIVLLIFHFRSISIKKLFNWSGFDFKFFLLAILSVFLVGIGASYIQVTVMNLFQIQYPDSIRVLTEILTPNNAFELTGWILIMFLIVGPCEELFARACIQKGFQNSFKDRENGHLFAIIGSSICFMIFHVDPFRFFPIFCESVVIGYVYYKSKSLGTVIILHGVLNSLLITLSIFGI